MACYDGKDPLNSKRPSMPVAIHTYVRRGVCNIMHLRSPAEAVPSPLLWQAAEDQEAAPSGRPDLA